MHTAHILINNKDAYLMTQGKDFKWSLPKYNSVNIINSQDIVKKINTNFGINIIKYDTIQSPVLVVNEEIFLSKEWDGILSQHTNNVIGTGWFSIPEIFVLKTAIAKNTRKLLHSIAFLFRHEHRYLLEEKSEK